MSNDNQSTIVAAPTPGLTHLEAGRRRLRPSLDSASIAVVVLVLAIALAIAYWRPWQTLPDAAPATGDASTAQPQAAATGPAPSRPAAELAPFAASQQALAREQAQKALAAFVEKQLVLEETMSVAEWGQRELDAAMAAAKAGDEAFVKEQFPESLGAYEEAVGLLDGLISRGGALFAEHLQQARQAVDARDPEGAQAALAEAAIIRPEADEIGQLAARIDKLPQVIYLLRAARNHELGGRVSEALATYGDIRALDPATVGLDALIAQAGAQQTRQDLNGYIAAGFSALERQQFDSARAAFRNALALAPDNEVARGGLEQLQRDVDLDRIRGHRQRAENAMAEENWAAAISEYEAIRNLDGNIQFAVAGLASAQAHERAEKLLSAIAREPQRLSSEQLFLQASQILDEAKALTARGPRLSNLIGQATTLLNQYRDPVDVVLRSDNATDIVISNVGRLGFFAEKTLSLRPGTYTIRGSQNGCRDLYLSVEVLPGLEPLDLSCPERIAQGR